MVENKTEDTTLKKLDIAAKIAVLCSFITIASGILVISAWLSNVLILASVKTEYIPMAFSTALMFVLCGAALLMYTLWNSRRKIKTLVKWISIFITLYSLFFIIQFAANLNLDLEQTLRFLNDIFSKSRMSGMTAFNFLLAGISLLFLTSISVRALDKRYMTAGLASVIVLVGMIFIAGYALGKPLFYSSNKVVPVAYPTSFSFVALGIGIFAAAKPGFRIRQRVLEIFAERQSFFQHYMAVSVILLLGLMMSVVLSITVQRLEKKAQGEDPLYQVGVLGEGATIILLAGILFTMLIAVYVLTLQRQSETIQKARDFYLTLLEDFPALIWRSGTDAKCDYFNKTWLEFTGRKMEQETGDGWAEGVHPDDLGQCVKNYLEAFNARLPFYLEYRLRRHDGEYRLISDFGRPFYDLDASFAGYIGSCYDVTENKQAEEERLTIRKLESIGILAGGIAHDFNNLLTVILGNISIAKMRRHSDIEKVLESAEDACDKAKELSYRLITFSEGGKPFKRISSITTLLKESAVYLLNNTNISYDFSFVDFPYPVAIDEDQMREVINNLIVNAKEGMPEGGEIEVSTQNVTMDEQNNMLLKPGKYIKISIKDTGTGISEKNLKKVFDPYFSTKEMGSQKGTGLGLAVAYSILKHHDGMIAVESKLGSGTTFNIYLPAAAETL